jgi:hypothetical protein
MNNNHRFLFFFNLKSEIKRCAQIEKQQFTQAAQSTFFNDPDNSQTNLLQNYAEEQAKYL